MKRKSAVVLAIFILLNSLSLFIVTNAVASEWNGTIPSANLSYSFSGSGTEADPWLIQSAAELAQFAANVNGGEKYAGKHFKLTVDVDLASKPWTPIGGGASSTLQFSGVFDGGYHVVRNILINLPGTKYVGFFGSVNGALIKNFGIESGSITGGEATGGIAGHSSGTGSAYYNCFNMSSLTADVTSVSTGPMDIGGMLATADNNTPVRFEYCYNGGDMTGNGRTNSTTRVAGIVGCTVNTSGTAERFMDNCYNEGNISVINGSSSNMMVGGLSARYMQYSTVTNSGSSGNIEIPTGISLQYVGVLIGRFTQDEESRVFTVENNTAVAISGLNDVADGASLDTTYVEALDIPFAAPGIKFFFYEAEEASVKFNLPEGVSELPAGSKVLVDGVDRTNDAIFESDGFTLPTADLDSTVTVQLFIPTDDEYNNYVYKAMFDGENWNITELEGLKNLLGYVGVAIRTNNNEGLGQGMRFKSTISEVVKTAGADGYTVVEYGTLAKLGENETNLLYITSDVENKIGKGTAFVRDSLDRIFSIDAGSVHFTTVLIGMNPDQYKVDYSFRSYCVLSNGDNTIVVYGQMYNKNIYDVAIQIQDNGYQGLDQAGIEYIDSIIALA